MGGVGGGGRPLPVLQFGELDNGQLMATKVKSARVCAHEAHLLRAVAKFVVVLGAFKES